MSLVLGSVLLGVAYLAVLFSILAFRNPQGPRWTRNGLAGDLWVVALIAVGVLGFGHLVRFALTIGEAGGGVSQWFVAAAVLLVCVAATVKLKLGEKLARYTAMAEPVAAQAPSWRSGQAIGSLDPAIAQVSNPANDPVPGKPKPTGQSGGGRRRKAA